MSADTVTVLERLDYRTIVTTDPPEVKWPIDGIAARGHVTLLVGREKTGKSLLAMYLAAAVATGGGNVADIKCHPGRVLLVDAENGRDELHRRIRRTALGVEHEGNFEISLCHGFDLVRHIAVLSALVRELEPDLLVIDGFRTVWHGQEVESAEVASALDPLRDLVHSTGTACILLHHARKASGDGADAYRGGTGIGASVEHIVVLERVFGDPDRQRRRLSNPSSRFAAEQEDRWIAIVNSDGVLALGAADPYTAGRAATRDRLADEILDILVRRCAKGADDEGVQGAELARAVNRSPGDGTVRRALEGLRVLGDIVQDPDTRLWRARQNGGASA